jgi:DNA topoisomerase-1
VEVRRGRFGPFLLHGNRVANLPRGVEMEAVTLDEAVKLLAEKGKELKPKPGAKGRKAPAKAAPKAARHPRRRRSRSPPRPSPRPRRSPPPARPPAKRAAPRVKAET